MLRISQIKVNISQIFHENRERCVNRESWNEFCDLHEKQWLYKKAQKMLGCSVKEIKNLHIVRKSIDARKKQEIYYNYCVDIELKDNVEARLLAKEKRGRFVKTKPKMYLPPEYGVQPCREVPVIVGFGPAGMFCALELARAGFSPIVLEQGRCVEERIQDVETFWRTGQLHVCSNVQFGEGGAGTFSDGKLNTSVKDPSGRNRRVLEIFVEHGAPKEILYAQKPHIGTDALCKIVKSIRQEICDLGGTVLFQSKVTDLKINQQKNICQIEVNGQEWKNVQVLVLAIGHSARDTFTMLKERRITMEPKPFAVGVRVEHPQTVIDGGQYGELKQILPPADYKLTYQAKNGRSLFSFCMCPGGFVVNASSETNMLVVNGMSNQKRDEKNANSALVVNVVPEDFESTDVLAGMEFQRRWERLAYEECEGKIPVQLYGDFKQKKKTTKYGKVEPVHKGSSDFGNLWNCLPSFVCETLVEGMEAFANRIDGYAEEETLLSGVETRTSSPVRIIRNEKLESNIGGLYPCGEGAGYAGGITSAAMDGLRVYEAIRKKYTPVRNEEKDG